MKILKRESIERAGFRSPDRAPGEAGHKKRNKICRIKGPLVDYTYLVEENRYRDGEMIVQQGAHGSWIWVVLDGAVEISRESSRGPVSIVRLGEGCFIGTFTSLLFTEYRRSATVTAIGDVYLGLLDTLRLSGDFTSLSSDFRTFLLGLAGRLETITDRVVGLSMNGNRTSGFAGGEDPYRRKDSSLNDLFISRGGEISIMEKNAGGNLPFLNLGRGDMFGNIPFIDKGRESPRTPVTASTDLVTRKLDVAGIRREYDGLSGAFRNLIDNSCACVSLTTRLVQGFTKAGKPLV